MAMVRLSAKTDYALRAMIDLATRPTLRTTLPAIAERQGIPRKFLPTVFQSLIQAGFVHTIRGYGGGVEISCDPNTVTVLKIVECVEGPQQLFYCDSRGNDCSIKTECKLREVLTEAGRCMMTALESTTLASLIPADCED
jgi:Rrf2 family transcriptional regulator, nitric oxide-sensitive transcriptional repressor